jgi:hypothetical protein
VVTRGKQCERSSDEPGGAKGLCARHYKMIVQRGQNPEDVEDRTAGGAKFVGVKVPPALAERVVKAAKRAGVKLSRWVRTAVEEKLTRDGD